MSNSQPEFLHHLMYFMSRRIFGFGQKCICLWKNMLFFGQKLVQEIQSKALRLDKIKLLSKLEKCKGKEGAKEQEDRVLNGFVHLIHK